jgi:hypothetical protein
MSPGLSYAFAVAQLDHLIGTAHLVRDPTDVLALLVLAPAWGLWRRPARKVTGLPQTLGAWVVAVLALFATTATSCVSNAPYIELWHINATTIARQEQSPYGDQSRNISTDGGLHWTPVDASNGIVTDPSVNDARTTAVCTPKDVEHCFRVKNDHILESTDGGRHWVTSWTRPKSLPHQKANNCGGSGDVNSLTQILYVGTGPSAVVVLSLGTDGVLRRTVSGTAWQVVHVAHAGADPHS